jgi:hypothetical protein
MGCTTVEGVTTQTDCMIYSGYKDPDGYGRWDVRINGAKKTFLAHRLVYEMTHGVLPQGVVVRHTCDNPPCVNPFHLVTGTHVDNQADKVARGRQAKGEALGSSKLTEAAVREIRQSADSWQALAVKFSVTEGTIRAAAHRQTWKHVA